MDKVEKKEKQIVRVGFEISDIISIVTLICSGISLALFITTFVLALFINARQDFWFLVLTQLADFILS
ncbi:MAG: hypothetical protein HWN67_14745 [Candidatus Helarchaeota archaeon]|nr:hypothetical protein [Candidatus Helarchaeota archaeon]